MLSRVVPLSCPSERPDPDVCALIDLFADTFYQEFNTKLVRGEHEPIYLPAGQGKPYAQIVFAHGFFSSALHEIAHWCVAGERRRQLEDYGYWYCPDGRDEAQQAEFEKVEIKPQAIEWALTHAAGRVFQVSTDNLNGVEPDRFAFTQAVKSKLLDMLQHGFPPRAARFIKALERHFGTSPLTLSTLEMAKDG